MSAAAAERRRKMQEEEEVLTKYSDVELSEGWEFKIVRSHTGAFKKPDVLRKLVEEESQAGWVLLEKFDDNRVRFKRPVSAREGNRARLSSGLDPYRATYGISEGALVAVGLLAVFGSLALLMGILALAGAL